METWKTVVLRGNSNTLDHHRSLTRSGVVLAEPAREMVKLAPPVEPRRFELVRLPIRELARPDEKRDILARRARILGLEPCPALLAPKLRLQYKNQPHEEILWLVMDFIHCTAKGQHGFCLINRYGILWLGAYQGTLPIGREINNIHVVLARAA